MGGNVQNLMLTNKTTCRVRYGDTDKMGFVYHANYFRWFEAGRSDLFRELGISYKEIETAGIHLPGFQIPFMVRFFNPNIFSRSRQGKDLAFF